MSIVGVKFLVSLCKFLKCNEYHVFENRYVEILNSDNKKVSGTENRGKIVVTTLNKRLIPLLRYDTGDCGTLLEKTCKCGEKYILKIDGRIDKEFIIGSVHLVTNNIIDIVKNNSIGFKNCQICVYKENNMDKLHIKIQANEIKQQDLLYKMYIEYPDMKILINDNKICPVLIEKTTENEFVINKRTGKSYLLLDYRK